MAVSAADLEGFTLETEKKPDKVSGVTVSQIPEILVKLLATEAPKALKDPEYELVLRVPVKAPKPLKDDASADAKAEHAKATEAAEKQAESVVKQLALYAAAWGKGQDPKLYIHKVQNRKDMPKNHARLAVELDSDVPSENRPGRRAGR